MKAIILNILLMSCIIGLHAQELPGGFALNSYSAKQKHAFSFAGNPAALGQCLRWSAGVYGERPYMLDQLSVYRAMFALPLPSGGAVFSGGNGGHKTFLGLGYGRRMGKIDAGLQFNYSRFSAGHYGNAAAVQAGGGMIYHVNEQFRTGIHIINPISGSLHSIESLPYQYVAALGYDASEQFFLGAAIKKTKDLPVSFDLGLQYVFDKKLRASAGFQTEGGSFFFGGGFNLGNLGFDVVLAMHSQLGISPALAVSFYPKEK